MEEQCLFWTFGEMNKRREDMLKGYLERIQSCGLPFVELGRVDRNYGPKTIEDVMVSFLGSKFYSASISMTLRIGSMPTNRSKMSPLTPSC